MIQPIEFFAHGIPKGQPRPRAFSRNGSARMYDPGTAEGWKSQVAEAIRPHMPAQPMDVPLKVGIYLFFPRPKSHYGTGKKASELRWNAPDCHTAKPDADNAAKAILDALTTLRVWRDDSLVCWLNVAKCYSETPGARISICEASK